MREIPSGGTVLVDSNPSGLTLYAASQQLSRKLHRTDRGWLFKSYDVSPDDQMLARRFYTFEQGFGDLDFTWHFAPAVANSVVDTFVREGVTTAEQRDAFTLTDWANVIGAGWFGKLMHSLAFTSNGVYARFGNDGYNYKSGALEQILHVGREGEPDRLFDIGEQYEPADGMVYHTADITPQVRRSLRERMHAGLPKVERHKASPGCPAARHTASLLRGAVETDSHVQHMIAAGWASEAPERSTDEKVMLRQDYSAIDYSLMLLADKLEQYEHLYGNPVFTRDKRRDTRMSHVLAPPVDVLRYSA